MMELEKGEQFQEGDRYVASKNKAPFVRTSFSKYTKIFDMQEFDINQTDEELFRTHYSMLNMQQLRLAIDSIDQQIVERKNTVGGYILNYISVFKKDTVKVIKPDIPSDSIKIIKKDTLEKKEIPALNNLVEKKKSANNSEKTIKKKVPIDIPNAKSSSQDLALKKKNARKRTNLDPNRKITKQNLDQSLKDYDNILETFDVTRKQALADKATQAARSIKSNSECSCEFRSECPVFN